MGIMNDIKGTLINKEKVYTLEEASDLLGVKKRTLTNIVKNSKEETFTVGKKVGKRYLFSGENIHKYLGTASTDDIK